MVKNGPSPSFVGFQVFVVVAVGAGSNVLPGLAKAGCTSPALEWCEKPLLGPTTTVGMVTERWPWPWVVIQMPAVAPAAVVAGGKRGPASLGPRRCCMWGSPASVLSVPGGLTTSWLADAGNWATFTGLAGGVGGPGQSTYWPSTTGSFSDLVGAPT